MTTEKLRDPFNPDSGEFAKNIRAITGLDDTELKQSLKNYGWLEELPAIMDENDVVLVGHRRLRLARQLNIAPVIKKIRVGKGDDADAYRLKLALASNIGHQPLTRDDRKRIAEYLYGQKEWTMERIAEALDVTAMTVSRDLGNFNTPLKSKPAKTASNPRGAGRPKGSGKPRRTAPAPHKKQDEVAVLMEAGLTVAEIASQTGVGKRQVRHIVERVEIERKAKAEPTINAADLPMSAREKVETAVRQHIRRLDAEFERRVRDEISKRIDELILPHWKAQIAEAQTLYARRKALMDKETFNIIRRDRCILNSRASISDKKLGEAFNSFMRLEKFLLNEADSPTKFGDLPDNAAAWDRMRTKSKRTSGPTAMKRR